MRLLVHKPGMLTTVQDLGRWGHQSRGVSVSGAMDPFSLRLGNVLLGNGEGAAALELTVLGPELEVLEGGTLILAGGDLKMRLDGIPAEPWRVYRVSRGCRISFGGLGSGGCRANLCLAGGVEVPSVMGSRSTHLRARLGGFQGRALAAGDEIVSGSPDPLWARGEGLPCPEDLRPRWDPLAPLEVLEGPQTDAFTPQGLETFFGNEYAISPEADRMGYRFEGPAVEHLAGADIVSDAIPLGAIQVPGHGQPIAMLADRQTTGGYTKIGVLSAWSVAQLAQRLPGQGVRFRRTTPEEATAVLRDFEERLRRAGSVRASWRSRQETPSLQGEGPRRFRLRLEGREYDVQVSPGA
ncbi:biotin-dependent carboxyltransferase family protein [Aminomonas paucivorans]|uniref:5-oxoprolinase subunit C family protein n=1 Tax=Aminomonas paucivorans TaxID=81412 RepID=UPI003334A459